MLQAIRDKAQGWLAWVIVILISIPFALWGIQEYIGNEADAVAVLVNDQEISQQDLDRRYQQFNQDLRRQLGASYSPEMFDENRMRAEVLEDMILSSLVTQEADNLGLEAGDSMVRQAIMNIPAFQADGRFDPQAYEQAVRLQGMQTTMFEQQLRRSLVTNQLEAAITAGAFVTEKELQESVRLRDQKRTISYFVLPIDDFKDGSDLTDTEIQDYYDKNQERFNSPEQVKVEYVELDLKQIGETIKTDDETLKAYYDEHISEFKKPEERKASHILVTVSTDADVEAVDAARVKIDAIRQRIDAGEDFVEIAKNESDDPGSKDQGGDLGFFGKGEMDPAFENAAFSQQTGELGEAVRSQFGYHLIKVTEVKDGTIPSFEEKKAEVLDRYQKNEAERVFYDFAERLGDLTYEDPESLGPASEVLGLTIKTSDWMGRTGGEGVLASPKVSSAAFSDDVLIDRRNSEVIEVNADQAIVIRVTDHKESAAKPLDDVKAGIVNILKRKRSRDLIEAKAAELVKRLNGGVALDTVADGRELKQPDVLQRGVAVDGVPQVLSSSVFRLPRPKNDVASYSSTELDNGDYAILAFTAVEDGRLSDLDETARKQQVQTLLRSRSREYYSHLIADLRGRAEVTAPK